MHFSETLEIIRESRQMIDTQTHGDMIKKTTIKDHDSSESDMLLSCMFVWNPFVAASAVLNHNVPSVLPEITLIAKRRIFNSYTHSWWRHQMETFSALLALCAGIDRSPVNSPHKGQWRGALKFFLMGAWIHGWVNNREDADLRRHHAHHDVTGCNKRKDIVEIESLLYPLILWNLMQSPLWQI